MHRMKAEENFSYSEGRGWLLYLVGGWVVR